MKPKKLKLLYLPNTWEMIMNIERDLNNLKDNRPSKYFSNDNHPSKTRRKSQAKNR